MTTYRVWFEVEDACWFAQSPEHPMMSAFGDTPNAALHELMIVLEQAAPMTTYTITQHPECARWLCESSETPQLRTDGATPQEALTDFLMMEAAMQAVRLMAEAEEPPGDGGGVTPPAIYIEFREDGWPLCPRCGDDELWAHGPDMDIHNPHTLQQMIDAIRGCLYCGWKPQGEGGG